MHGEAVKVNSQGKCISYLVASQATGDTKDCSLRRDEPYLTFKSSKLYMHGAVHCAGLINQENNSICRYTVGLFNYCKRMFPHDCPDLCFVHKQSQDCAANPCMHGL